MGGAMGMFFMNVTHFRINETTGEQGILPLAILREYTSVSERPPATISLPKESSVAESDKLLDTPSTPSVFPIDTPQENTNAVVNQVVERITVIPGPGIYKAL